MEESMTDRVLSCADLAEILREVGTDLPGYVEELRELDAALGDGDLGVTMGLAAGAMAQVGALDAGEDLGLLLAKLGMEINKVSPSTFGTLLASAFLGAGGRVRGKAAAGPADLTAMGYGAIEGIKKRGKAELGDKTMLDTLVPAVEAFDRALQESGEVPQAFELAVAAAEAGMNGTAAMVAKYGRASWRREDSVGVRDAGATAMYFLFRSFAQYAAGRFS
jgi:phosphoenolpyruvate---glycerone phosphotransferase subunit DhaL